MSSKLNFAPRTFPSRIADLGFTVQLPRDWIAHDLPNEDVDFSNPTTFVPLALVTAPHAAIVFAFATRPAYDDGTLHDWSWYLLNHNQLKPSTVGAHQIGSLPALVGEARQASDLDPMVVRFAFIEDGKRLINITLTAPELLAEAVRDAWSAVLNSFVLLNPRGSTAAMQPKVEQADSVQPAAAVAQTKAKIPESASAPTPGKGAFVNFALANDTTSLDPEMPINANLRDRGVGLVPNVAAANDAEKCATLGAGAIMAQFDVPYGWHVIDDGKRTLIFEPSGKVQINLNLIPREGRGNAAILDAIEAEARESYPSPEFMRIKEGKIHAVGIRNIADGGQPLEQYHLLYPFRDDQMVMRARVTAVPEQASEACNLAELILESLVFDCFQLRDESQTAQTS